VTLARAEGLEAHARSPEMRIEDLEGNRLLASPSSRQQPETGEYYSDPGNRQ